MRKDTWKQRLGRGGLVLAALASIATSRPAGWFLDDSVTVPEIRLDTEQPEDMRHFFVRSSQEHTGTVIGHIHWDSEVATPAAAVRIQILADDGSLLREETESIQDAPEVDGKRGVTPFHLAVSVPCEAAPCEAGYGVKLSLVDGHPTESARVDYGFVASIEGSSPDEPDGAFVTVVQD